MPIRKDHLKTVLSTVQKVNGSYAIRNDFVRLFMNIILNKQLGVELPSIDSFLDYIRQDIRNIETISTRLAWQRELWLKEQLDALYWMDYAKCDIDLFHIEVRSIFDYLAKIIRRVSDKPKEVPDKGFSVLRTWLTKSQDNQKRLGKDLTDLVLSVDWFEEVRNVRDVNVHKGGATMVFLEKGRILFQVWKGFEKLISFPEIMYNENVVDFELYAGTYFGYLIAFLEQASRSIEKRLPPRKSEFGAGNPTIAYRELPAIYTWIERILGS
jgi:hypothetical protein